MKQPPVDGRDVLSPGAMKRVYDPPRLTVYGDVTSLTRGMNGQTIDGCGIENFSQLGNPSTNCD